VNALIIDDEIDICYLLSSILRKKNVQPNYVNSISEATTALKNQKPEIIFLDNHLPDGMGVDFIQRIKKNNPDTKVIMITAYDTTTDRSKAISNGVDYFIPKPFSSDMIYKTVDRLMQ
jgi:two-component system, OmpR family, response regulator